MDAETKQLLQSIESHMSKSNGDKKFFGFKIPEIAIICTFLITLIGFYLRTNDAMGRLIKSTDWLMVFAKNSDSFHSQVLGTQFEQGQPRNPGYEGRRREPGSATSISIPN